MILGESTIPPITSMDGGQEWEAGGKETSNSGETERGNTEERRDLRDI